MDFLGTVQRFAGDRLRQLRDNVAVPVLDRAMEAGVVPSDAGMYARWATGTEKPLTRRPKDIQQHEVQTHINTARRQGKERPNGDIPIHRGGVYPFSQSKIKDSLGSYTVNEADNLITDRYDFNYYNKNHPDVGEYTGGFDQGMEMLQRGNPRGAIPILDQLGIVKPGQGYDVRMPYKNGKQFAVNSNNGYNINVRSSENFGRK